jgi:hypothetical protein
MKDWINWSGGECPIKSDKTMYILRFDNCVEFGGNGSEDWRRLHINSVHDIIAYRIIEDHEPKMTREQITAQIEALQKQLGAMPLVKRMWFDGSVAWSQKNTPSHATHYFDIETINSVPHIHGVAMKEVAK